MRTTTIPAATRCEYSMTSARFSSSGTSVPEHCGQSVPHPRPDFVARTKPPRVTRAKVASVDATASRRKRAIARMLNRDARVRTGRRVGARARLSWQLMRSRVVGMALATCVCLASGACGDSTAPGASDQGPRPSAFETPFTNDAVYPRFVSSQLAVGENRFLVGLLNDEDAPVGSPRVDMHVEFFDLDRSTTEPVSETDMRWVWITRPYVGLYASTVEFESPGKWGAEISVTGPNLDETVRSSFVVRSNTT